MKKMTDNFLGTWWQQYREAKSCNRLYHELLILVRGQSALAERLINLEKNKHPGQSESWYLDKVVYDLRRAA
jgi:hypothetical protein